jgi:hypothetical protein
MNVRDGNGSGRRSAARLIVLASVIGITALWSQSVRAQVRTAGVGEVTERDEKLKKAMKGLLLEPDSRHDRGWQLARDCGPALAPLLWDMQAAERANQDRRALLASAAILAGGAESDEPALAAVGEGQQAVQLIVCLLFAMQPSRGRDQPQATGNKDWADLYWERVRGRRKEPDEMLTVAALLGSRRFAGASATPAAADLVKRMPGSPGVIAAALFAGVSVEGALRPFLSISRPPRSADLVWRGRLLGSLRDGAVPDDEVVQFAQQVYALTGDAQAGVRSAAALVLSRANRLPPDKERPPWWMLQLLAADPRAAEGLARWIGPVPDALDENEKPIRLAVEYVLGRTPRAVVDDRARWGSNPLIRRHVALALAWRLLGMPKPEPIEVAMPGLPEWFFVQWASGAHASKAETIRGPDDRDDLLDRVAALMQEDGRLSRPVARELLEGTLWRWRSHPGLGLFDAQAALVCDLLLTGSDAGRKYQKAAARLPDRYLPKGLGSDSSVFELGVELWDWLALSEPRLPIPTECLLR